VVPKAAPITAKEKCWVRSNSWEPLHDAQMTVRVARRGQEYPDEHPIVRESGKRRSQACLLFRRQAGRIRGSALGFWHEPTGEKCDQQSRQNQ